MLKANVKRDTYWWTEKDAAQVVDQLQSVDTESVGMSAVRQAWSRNTMIYFSALVRAENWDTGLNFAGVEGELVEMIVPKLRSLIRQLVSIVTKQKLNFSVLSESSAQNTIQTARLGNALCKQIVREQQLDVVYENMFEHSLLTGLGILYRQWRTDKGEFFTTDSKGKDHYMGDLQVSAPTVWDIKFDASIPDPKNWDWVEVRQIHNRWNLIAQFPDCAEELKRIPSIRESENRFMAECDPSPSDDDMIYVYAAYHVPCPAIKEGRMIVYASNKAVLLDDDNYYGCLPIDIARAEPVPGSSYGYPFITSLIPLQEMLDNTLSSIATNNSQFGVQNVTALRGSNVTPTQINGMNFFLYDSPEGGNGKPEALQLTQSAPEAYKFVEVLDKLLLDLSLINAALRGDPPTGVTSGAAIATLTTTALESVASSSKAARDCLRRTLMGSIECYQRFASVERELTIGDMGGQVSSMKFVGKDLDGIKDIDLVENNPIMQTQNGRDAMADKLMATGAITDVKAYFAVQEGAPVSVLYANELSEEDLVKRENEALMNGQAVLVTNADDHPYHIMMHGMSLKDPKVRLNNARVKEITAHMLEHYSQEMQVDPVFAAMVRTGKAPQGGMMPPPMAGGAPAPGQAPGGGGAPQDGKPAAPAKPADDMLKREPQKGAA